MPGLGSLSGDESQLRELWSLDVGDYVLDLAWSPQGDQLALVTVDGQVFLIHHADERGQLRPLGKHLGGASSVAWRCDSREVATAGHDGKIKLWDPESGLQIRELQAGTQWATKVTYRPGDSLLASAAGRVIRLWDSDGRLAHESSDHSSTVADIAWNPDGSSLAVAAYNGVTIHILHKLGEPRKYTWKGSSLVLAWSPKSKYIATGEQDSTVHFWNVKSGEDCQMWGFPTKVLELSWHYSGNSLVTGGGDSVVLWDCSGKGPSGRKPIMFEGHTTRITQLAFQHRADLLASGDAEGRVMLWDPLHRQQSIASLVLDSSITRLEWSIANRVLATGQRSGIVSGLQIQ